MRNHQALHRRQGGKDILSAIADAFDGEDEVTTTKTNTKAAVKTTTAAATSATRSAVSVVYVTADPTFEGPIGGYKTLGVDDAEETKTSTTSEKPKTTPTPVVQVQASTTTTTESSIIADTEVKTTPQTTLQTSTGLPSEISAPTTTLKSSVDVVAASGSATRSSTSKKAATQQSSVASATASATATPSPGMSAGGKAGLAIGILLLVGAILAIALFVFKKRKDKAKKEEIENEKSTMFATSGRPASTKTNATAPQLSLRPVTQFLPNLGAKRSSQGNVLNTMAAATPNRQQTSPEQNRNNPFGNSAEIIDSNNANGPSPVQLNGPSGEVIVAAAALAPAGGLARGASKRVNGASPMDYTTKNAAFMGPPSPSGTEFSENSEFNTTPTPSGTGAAIVAAGGPANTAVHRVQLDFKPSMEDELELRAGQLVRVLHEYDDGWVSRHEFHLVSFLILLGSLHSSRSLSTRCRSSYMSVNSSCQATPSTTTTAAARSRSTHVSTKSRSTWSRSSRSNACKLSSWYEWWPSYQWKWKPWRSFNGSRWPP